LNNRTIAFGEDIPERICESILGDEV